MNRQTVEILFNLKNCIETKKLFEDKKNKVEELAEGNYEKVNSFLSFEISRLIKDLVYQERL